MGIDRQGNAITDSTRKFFGGALSCRLFSRGLVGDPVHTHVSGECLGRFPPLPKSTKAAGDADQGRAIFNVKGACYYCDGIDGNKDQRPHLGPHLRMVSLDPFGEIEYLLV